MPAAVQVASELGAVKRIVPHALPVLLPELLPQKYVTVGVAVRDTLRSVEAYGPDTKPTNSEPPSASRPLMFAGRKDEQARPAVGMTDVQPLVQRQVG